MDSSTLTHKCTLNTRTHAFHPAEAATWSSRCEGLRGSLAAQEAHAAALEAELTGRPTQQAVEELRQQVGPRLTDGRACPWCAGWCALKGAG